MSSSGMGPNMCNMLSRVSVLHVPTTPTNVKLMLYFVQQVARARKAEFERLLATKANPGFN